MVRADGHDEADTPFSQICERGEKRIATDNKPRRYAPLRARVVGFCSRGVVVSFVPGGIFFCLPKGPDRTFSVYRSRLPGYKIALRVKLTAQPPLKCRS